MMKLRSLWLRKMTVALSLTGLLAVFSPLAHADEGDPPTRVARISYLNGSVSFEPSGTTDWGNAELNRPMTIGDKIWVDKDGRAELQTGQVAIHLDSMTSLSFLNLDQNTTQMRLTEGAINFRVRELRADDVDEVDVPNLAFTVKQAGAFRIDVNENGDVTQITVIRGEGVATANGQTYDIQAGQRAIFTGAENPQYQVGPAPAPDDFDQWAMDRDLGEDNSTSAQYVSRDTPGYSDLDNYGTWSEQPDYGAVWYPNDVGPDWAPYSNGYWSWVGPWGWTWIDYYPWGFAPFHYGRWSYIGGRWGWCPGSYYSYPVYGPAFVGFLGGGGWSVGFGFGYGGGIGWFPLGWGEPFHPWWHCSRSYINIINVHNTHFHGGSRFVNTAGFRNFNYAYAHNARAVTVASHSAFVGGRSINRGAYHLTDASLRRVQVTNHTNFQPGRESYLGARSTRGNIARPPASIHNRSVVAMNRPAAAASHMPVRTEARSNVRSAERGFSGKGNTRPTNTMGRSAESAANTGRFNGARNASPMNSRQRALAADKPQGSMRGGSFAGGRSTSYANSAGTRNGGRVWSAQGNTTDRGRAPAGFGRNDSPRTASRDVPAQSSRMTRSDRPPWARSEAPGGVNARGSSSYNGGRSQAYNNVRGGERSYQPTQRDYGNRGNSPNYGNARSYPSPRSYGPSGRAYPSRSYSAPRNYNYSQPSRSYSAPSRSYSAPSRSYSAPSRSYSAPSRSYSAPSRGSYGGGGSRGGGGNHGGGGGSRGGSSHGSGGSHGRH